ncbi:MAG TPA: VOC family protein [Chthoniobacterales bacterium]|nr:VOC family protein [Chthoniobacterales bacterium]
MQVTEIAFSLFPVTDLKRARAFYEGMLGLKPGMVYEGDGSDYIEYEIGPGVVAIGAGSEQLKTSVALEVDDFDQAINELKQAGAKFALEPLDFPGCRMAAVFDPDGNTVTIHRRKQSN